jgi:hypothetical protein
MKKRKHGRRLTISANRHASQQRAMEMEPEDLAFYMRRAEKDMLPLIKDRHVGPAIAQFLLAQQTQVLVTGDRRLTTESGMAIANRMLDLWQDGVYTPGPAYPYTLEETLLDLQQGLKAKENYDAYFQPFTPANGGAPRGIGDVAGGIVKHPETNLWQIWMMTDGPCTYLAAYRDPVDAQRNLERIIRARRRGESESQAALLATKIQALADGEPKQLPYDMIVYLVEHLDCYMITL